MKKLIISFVALALVVVACENNADEAIPNQEATVDMSDFSVYTSDDVSAKSTKDAPADKCYSMKVLNQQLKDNPGLEQRMFEIEKHTRTLIAAKGAANKGKPGGGTTPPASPMPYVGAITIPVVINIIESSAGKVTQAQIDSQIKILNEDFNNLNPNTSDTPNYFASLVADVNIRFTVAGVIRKISNKSSWGTADAMKTSKRGGINPTDPTNNLNIWVCEIGGGILGYAQFPGGSLSTDGVVITTDGFGETSGVYGDGRTATHEIGHWLNLRHIWGDGGCGVDDYVSDTPIAGAPNYGNSDGSCQGVYNSCNEGSGDLPDMTMNYMDYVYDNCMYMFTKGQNDRMRTIFGTGGSRVGFVQ